jgi:NAD(P)H-quinone oxidoreductase subunit 5
MNFNVSFEAATPLVPVALLLLAMLLSRWPGTPLPRLWSGFHVLSLLALAFALLGVFTPGGVPGGWYASSALGATLAVLVQFLGHLIGVFSARYLEGEAAQRRYITALAGVLAAVQTLIIADHWLVLIGAWALVGVALQSLLCFYPDRPFALLAAHKKRLADRLADVLLVAAAALAWWNVGSGSLTDLLLHIEREGASLALQASAMLLVLAVVLRMALLPVHGWLIQVMEAPTPVSALLHAGVVNLGGFVLIRFAPLLEQAPAARALLVVLGLATAVLAGMVMLTRISIKVRLAWSTVAQMGFLALECGLGLYTLAALHLIGHSLYKAHAFLSSSMAVRQTRLQAMQGPQKPLVSSLWIAPLAAMAVVLTLQTTVSPSAWPWWWSLVLGLAWAPLLWLSMPATSRRRAMLRSALMGLLMVLGLTGVALLAHTLPLGLRDAPHANLGLVALAGMGALYLGLVLLHTRPQVLEAWRRSSYAGFYVDEHYTRLALWLWPTRWMPEQAPARPSVPQPLADAKVSE